MLVPLNVLVSGSARAGKRLGEAPSHSISSFAGIWRPGVVESTEEEDEEDKESEVVHMHPLLVLVAGEGAGGEASSLGAFHIQLPALPRAVAASELSTKYFR